MHTRERLVVVGQFKAAEKHNAIINQLVHRDEAAWLAGADSDLARKVASLRAQQELETEALMLRIQRNRAEHKHHWQVNAGRMALAQRNMSSELSQRHNREAKRATEMIRAGLEPLGRVPNRKLGNTSFGVKGQARVLHVSDGTSPSRPSSVVRPTKMHGATLIKMSAM
ncbi:MAG: hypothetical protein SGPRY_004778 [Prymnesium sp.]